MRNYKVAIIGAGSMAREHIKAFSSIPGATVAGIHSRTISKANALAAEFSIPNVVHNLADLYIETKADIVVVTVSILGMLEVAQEVVKHPWVCLFEKRRRF